MGGALVSIAGLERIEMSKSGLWDWLIYWLKSSILHCKHLKLSFRRAKSLETSEHKFFPKVKGSHLVFLILFKLKFKHFLDLENAISKCQGFQGPMGSLIVVLFDIELFMYFLPLPVFLPEQNALFDLWRGVIGSSRRCQGDDKHVALQQAARGRFHLIADVFLLSSSSKADLWLVRCRRPDGIFSEERGRWRSCRIEHITALYLRLTLQSTGAALRQDIRVPNTCANTHFDKPARTRNRRR